MAYYVNELSESDMDEICYRYRSGQSVDTIRIYFKVRGSRVSEVLKENGILTGSNKSNRGESGDQKHWYNPNATISPLLQAMLTPFLEGSNEEL